MSSAANHIPFSDNPERCGKCLFYATIACLCVVTTILLLNVGNYRNDIVNKITHNDTHRNFYKLDVKRFGTFKEPQSSSQQQQQRLDREQRVAKPYDQMDVREKWYADNSSVFDDVDLSEPVLYEYSIENHLEFGFFEIPIKNRFDAYTQLVGVWTDYGIDFLQNGFATAVFTDIKVFSFKLGDSSLFGVFGSKDFHRFHQTSLESKNDHDDTNTNSTPSSASRNNDSNVQYVLVARMIFINRLYYDILISPNSVLVRAKGKRITTPNDGRQLQLAIGAEPLAHRCNYTDWMSDDRECWNKNVANEKILSSNNSVAWNVFLINGGLTEYGKKQQFKDFERAYTKQTFVTLYGLGNSDLPSIRHDKLNLLHKLYMIRQMSRNAHMTASLMPGFWSGIKWPLGLLPFGSLVYGFNFGMYWHIVQLNVDFDYEFKEVGIKPAYDLTLEKVKLISQNRIILLNMWNDKFDKIKAQQLYSACRGKIVFFVGSRSEDDVSGAPSYEERHIQTSNVSLPVFHVGSLSRQQFLGLRLSEKTLNAYVYPTKTPLKSLTF
ncbi:metallophosphoesterase [Phenacoccus solenopsis nudivirus]|nr:metallophosphoesterase [Phenacoccus solenopsis nudivirus]